MEPGEGWRAQVNSVGADHPKKTKKMSGLSKEKESANYNIYLYIYINTHPANTLILTSSGASLGSSSNRASQIRQLAKLEFLK